MVDERHGELLGCIGAESALAFPNRKRSSLDQLHGSSLLAAFNLRAEPLQALYCCGAGASWWHAVLQAATCLRHRPYINRMYVLAFARHTSYSSRRAAGYHKRVVAGECAQAKRPQALPFYYHHHLQEHNIIEDTNVAVAMLSVAQTHTGQRICHFFSTARRLTAASAWCREL